MARRCGVIRRPEASKAAIISPCDRTRFTIVPCPLFITILISIVK
jgi:hypothetical protein